MTSSFLVLFYRYSSFAITIVSNAVICSAAAWNFPIAKNANLPAQLHVDTYMVFLGAFSLLVVIPSLFADMFSQRFITGRVWVECLWVDLLWLLHVVGTVVVTTTLPRGICTPQAEHIDGNSCTSAKLIMAFSWICTINLFIYLVFLVISAVLHQKQDDSVWSAQVRSYPWYQHFYCHKLGSSPEIPPRDHQVPIVAPQPRRPIRLHTRSMLSSHSVERGEASSHDAIPAAHPSRLGTHHRALTWKGELLLSWFCPFPATSPTPAT
ncbi:hypothetical protein BJV78DRAFT_915230 [Lactifluus subvellereus]|nr:hypothetical protein BJV78DRAFT_915230 [Lactifluus subvellereus]